MHWQIGNLLSSSTIHLSKCNVPFRELKNKSTGIDIIVPEYQIIPGKIVNTVLYHVIVITRLFYFKTRQHKESDLVQFAVSICKSI